MAWTMRKRVIWKDKKDSIFEGYISHSALNSLNLKRLFPVIIDFKNVEKKITGILLLKKKQWSLSTNYIFVLSLSLFLRHNLIRMIETDKRWLTLSQVIACLLNSKII